MQERNIKQAKDESAHINGRDDRLTVREVAEQYEPPSARCATGCASAMCTRSSGWDARSTPAAVIENSPVISSRSLGSHL
ncbi:hypothetical protein ABZ942_13430 [Nocardia sp. NPDC046473]|uniref:hypothetical protein n=1 Tax=Nocardia sp. NPDC046473 TaxID=3155733 RepID=UPI0033CC5E03